MICEICSEEKGYSVIMTEAHSFMWNVKYLAGVCFDCYETVPKHIPSEQIRKFLERRLMVTNPNGYMRFKSALGIETDINVCVKISGNICIWLPNNQKLYLPNQNKMNKQDWFKSLVANHGEYQGLFQRDVTIEIPGEAEPGNKLNW